VILPYSYGPSCYRHCWINQWGYRRCNVNCY
jgi:hypothetical protein